MKQSMFLFDHLQAMMLCPDKFPYEKMEQNQFIWNKYEKLSRIRFAEHTESIHAKNPAMIKMYDANFVQDGADCCMYILDRSRSVLSWSKNTFAD